MLALILLAASPAAFTLEPVKPGVFKLASVEDPAARLTLTVSPWPPPAASVPAEVAFGCEPEVVTRVLAVLEKHSDQPRTAAPAVTLDGPAAFAARLDGKVVKLGASGTLNLDEKNAQAWFENLDPPARRLIEATLRGVPKRNVPLAKLDQPLRIAGVGAEPLWSGQRGLLFLEGKLVKMFEPGPGKARVLGHRALRASISGCGTDPAAICAVADGLRTVVVFGGAKTETLEVPKGLALTGRRLLVSSDGRWVGAELVADVADDKQHLWFWDRKARKTVRWSGEGDTAHALTFTSWGSKGVLFSRTAPCLDTEAETVSDAACLLELETGRLTSVGNARTTPAAVTAPDKAHRLTYVSMLPVIEQADGGEPVRITVEGVNPAWVSSTALLIGADPLLAIDLGGKPRRIIEDRVQFAGGQLEGARVWYQLSDGLYVARVTGL